VSVGSTDAPKSAYLVLDDETVATDPSTDQYNDEDDMELEDRYDHQLLDDIYLTSMRGEIDLDDIMVKAARAKRHQGSDAEHLSKVWRISTEAAERTLNITTETSNRTDDPKLSRNYGTNDRILRYKRINEHFFMDTFFATRKAKQSSRGHTCCQLFVSDKGFVFVVPMKTKNTSDILQAVKEFPKEIGSPEAIICDAAREQKSHDVGKFLGEIGTTLRVLQEGTPWANKAELYIGLIKEAVRKYMKASNCPLALWDYCVERRARINNMTAKYNFKLHGSNAHTVTTGDEGDISNLCRYDWYEWCYFRDQGQCFPFNKEVLGRVLGPSRTEGNEMAQWILKSNGEVVPRRSHRPLKTEEIHSETENEKRSIFNDLIEKRHGTATRPSNTDAEKNDNPGNHWNEYEEYEDEDEMARVVEDTEDIVDANGRLFNTMPAYNQILNAEVSLQMGEDMAALWVSTGKPLERMMTTQCSTLWYMRLNSRMGKSKNTPLTSLPKTCCLKSTPKGTR
jgi:hypothetical protein